MMESRSTIGWRLNIYRRVAVRESHGVGGGAEATVITSASSKTSIALAWTIAQRGGHAIGLTSARHEAFVNQLGCYAEVIPYDEIGSINTDRRSVVVDMAGNGQVLAAIYNHFGGSLAHSMAVGGSH